jgi:hypothetical protein
LRVFITSERALDGLKQRLASTGPEGAVLSDRAQAGGKVIIAMRLSGSGRDVEITLPHAVACTPALRAVLKDLNGVADVELI